MSLKSAVLFLVKSNGEASFDELYALAREFSKKPDNLTRRCRELSSAGLIEPTKAYTKDGVEYIAGYRAL